MANSGATRRTALGTFGVLAGGAAVSRASGQLPDESAARMATARRRSLAENAYIADPLVYNPVPTDDAAKLQATLDEAAATGRADLATPGLGCSISFGLRYSNAFGLIEGKAFAPITAAPGATIEAMLAPAMWEENARSFPAVAYADKFNSRKADISLDGNLANGATVANGYVAIPFNALETGFKIRNVSGTGYRLTHSNKNGNASVNGNLIINRMYGHSVENSPTVPPAEYGYHFGADGNGKLTEGDPLCIHSYRTKTAARIGSAQGWMYMFARHAVTDDGVLCFHANRTWFYGTVIDEFGYGHDGGKTSFTGIHLGSLTNVEGANQGLLGGTVLSRADAGDTSSFTYTGLSFQSNGAPGGKAVILADAHIHLKGSGAHTRGVVQITDSGNVAAAGTIHDLHISGSYARETVETPLTLLSPYVKAHHVSHGKELAWEGRNDRGHHTRNLDALDALGGKTSDWCELRMSKAGVATGAPAAFAAVTSKAAGPMMIEVQIMATSADTVGYAMRGKTYLIGLQRHTSGSAAVTGTPAETGDTGNVSTNAGVRELSALAVTASSAGDVTTLYVEVTAAGSSAPASVDIVYRIRTLGLGSSSGQARVDPA